MSLHSEVFIHIAPMGIYTRTMRNVWVTIIVFACATGSIRQVDHSFCFQLLKNLLDAAEDKIYENTWNTVFLDRANLIPQDRIHTWYLVFGSVLSSYSIRQINISRHRNCKKIKGPKTPLYHPYVWLVHPIIKRFAVIPELLVSIQYIFELLK